MAGLAWAELGDDLLVRQYILDRSESNKPHDIEPPTSTTLTVALLYLMHRTAKDTVSIAPRARVLDPSSTKTSMFTNPAFVANSKERMARRSLWMCL